MVNINLLNSLLNNYLNISQDIEAAVLITTDGVVITSIIGKEMAEEDIGGIAHLIRYITDLLVIETSVKFSRIPREISSQQHQFLFRQVKSDIVFVSICSENAETTVIKAYGEYCAKKIEKILNNEEVSPEIPSLKPIQKEAIKDEYVFKICVIGNAAVGKTTSITQFAESRFESNYKPTIGTSIVKKDCIIEKNSLVHLQIWDIAGQELWAKMRKIYYGGSVGALIIFDVTRPSTFNAVEKWLQEYNNFAGSSEIAILVGNKIDLVEDRKISYEEAKEKANKLDLPYFETSAKTKENIDTIFLNISRLLVKAQLESNFS